MSEPRAPSVPGPDPTRVAWSAIALLTLVQFAAYVDRAMPAVVAPLMKAELGLSDAGVGALQGPAFVGLYVVGLLIAGQWFARANPWWVAFCSVLVWTAGAALFALAPAYGWMVAGRVLLGAGQAAFAPAALALLGGQGDPGRRAHALSLFTTGSSTGRSAALLLGGAAVVGLSSGAWGLSGWRTACLVLLLPNCVLAVWLAAAAIGSSPPLRSAAGGLKAALAAAGRRPGQFASIAVAGSACVCAVQAGATWAPSMFHRQFGVSAGHAALIFGGIVVVFAPLGHLAAGWLLASAKGRAWGPAPFIGGAIAAAAACAVALPFAGYAHALILISGLTASGGLAVASTLIGLQGMTRPGLRPAMGALFLAMVSAVGVGGGPWLTGMISDGLQSGGRTASLPNAMAVVICLAALVAVLLSWRMGRSWRDLDAIPGKPHD